MSEVIATATNDHTTLQVLHRGTDKFKFFVQITARHHTKNMYVDLSQYRTGHNRKELEFPVDKAALSSWGSEQEHGWWLRVHDVDGHVKLALEPSGHHNGRYHAVQLSLEKHLLA